MMWQSQTSLDGIAQCDENGVDWLDALKWVRNKSDELAIANGCWFDPNRAAFAMWWQESQLTLYEDPFAGLPIRFLSHVSDPTFDSEEFKGLRWDIPPIEEEWGLEAALNFYANRMRRHNQLFAAGEHMHWHAEAIFQAYGWVRESEDERWYSEVVRRHQKAIVFCAKKNGKSPFTAAQSLYLAFGDGVGGAAVGFAASDLGQAKSIIGNHLFNMVDMSPTLNTAKTNKNECSVEFNRCRIYPISAGNEKTANAQHGKNMNGGVIDEVHVCGKQVYDRMNRAFISRKEPMLWEVSTAGDNPESWGKSEFDKACAIRDGDIAADNVYVAVYAAPQNATDDEIRANIEKYIRMANPALGHIVSMDQSVKDFEQSRHTAAEFATYKYEKLNIWVNASTAWLPPGLWASCGGWKFDDVDLMAPCVIGFDNANQLDLACAVLTWEYWFSPDDANNPLAMLGDVDPDDKGYDEKRKLRRGCIQRPIFWTNATRLSHLQAKYEAFNLWEAQGLIRYSHGHATSESMIAKDLHEVCTKYNVIGMVHDPWHCNGIVDFLTNGVKGPNGEIIYEPILSPTQVYAMLQTTNKQAGPVASYERDLNRELIGHEDHPVLTWQFGHATVKSDGNGNIKIEKENRKSFRTVDGVQAAVMGRYGLLDHKDFADSRLNFYEQNTLEEI